MIIDSLLDTDLYKFTMMQCVLHQFPAAQAEYKFKCRNPGTDLQAVIGPINEEIDHLCALHFRKDELDYLRSLRFMKSDFIDFLELFHLKRSCIEVKKAEGSDTDIEIRIRGPWLHTIMFEIPVLAIVNECYYRKFYPNQDLTEGRRRLKAKMESIKDIQDIGISEYGTRRRFSKAWQEEVIKTMQATMGKQFTGTSNVYYAMQLGLTPLGTMAPFEWGEHLIEHYRKNRCDPKTKTLIFSDMLDFPKVISLYNAFHGRIRLGFGIGTNLVNDLGIPALQNVIKLIRCNDQPVAKLSDDPIKSMCEDESYLRYLKSVFNI